MPTRKKAAKKTAKKKTAAKAKKKSVGPKPIAPIQVSPGEPCICQKKSTGWWCMKKENGKLIPCHGPYKTKKACEEKTCG